VNIAPRPSTVTFLSLRRYPEYPIILNSMDGYEWGIENVESSHVALPQHLLRCLVIKIGQEVKMLDQI